MPEAQSKTDVERVSGLLSSLLSHGYAELHVKIHDHRVTIVSHTKHEKIS